MMGVMIGSPQASSMLSRIKHLLFVQYNTKLFTKSTATAKLPKIWRKANVVTLLKPSKAAEDSTLYACIAPLHNLVLLSPIIEAIKNKVASVRIEAAPTTCWHHAH